MKIANAPCSWGVLEFELDGNAPDYAQVLNEMHRNRLPRHRIRRLGIHADESKTPPHRTCGTRVEDVRCIRRCRTRR